MGGMKKKKTYVITIQRAVRDVLSPTTLQLKKWVQCVLENRMSSAELTLRIVSTKEIIFLNTQYRHKKKSTNVLSFPSDLPKTLKNEIYFLGDIAICADVVNQEAKEQNKAAVAHWAHMVTHGVLHLLGYDHKKNKEAMEMESEEILILKKLGFPNPWGL